MHGIKKVIYSGKTKFQNVEILELYNYGKALILDGKLQSAVYDEAIYHEALVHPAMITHDNPERVLVIGGGEGATIREVLKHECVKSVTMVDLDREVVELSKKYLPELHKGAFDDQRVELVYADGRKYLEDKEDEFDIIIVDVTDPLEGGPSYKLYTLEFYRLAEKALKKDGIIVTQATSPSYMVYAYATILRTMASIFKYATPYYTFVPAFVSLWGFVAASHKYDVSKVDIGEVDSRIKKRIRGELKFYDGITHKKMMLIDKFTRSIMEKVDNIATDERPVFMPA